MFSTDTWLIVIASMMINAVLFGAGATAVLAVPALAAHAAYLIPAVVIVSLVAAPVLAFWIAPRMRIRNWGRKAWNEGDLISG